MRLRVLLALALGASLAAPAAAQMPETPPGKWWKKPRVVNLLKLSPEQQDRLEEIFLSRRKSFIDLKAEVEKNQIDVEELVTKKDSDPKTVSAAIDALELSRAKLRKSVAMMFLEQKSVLTPQQWTTLLERRDEWRRERMEQRRGEFRGDDESGPSTRGPGRRGMPPPAPSPSAPPQ